MQQVIAAEGDLVRLPRRMRRRGPAGGCQPSGSRLPCLAVLRAECWTPATCRLPRSLALLKYMLAVGQREPHNHERLLEVGGLPPLGGNRPPAAPASGVLKCQACRCCVACLPAWSHPLPWPRAPCMTVLQLCERIASDPDRSHATLRMKREAASCKQEILGQRGGGEAPR